jgi:signal transduction histidine kinase
MPEGTRGSDDDARVRQIDAYDVLEGRDAALQALVDLAAQVCAVPTAAINLISATEQHQVAASGFEASICAREDSMCAAVLNANDTVIVADASVDERFRDNPFVTGDIGDVRFYASAPLISRSGVTVGRLCIFDSVVRELSPHQAGTLVVLAERIVDVLELRLRTHQLEASLAALTQAEEDLRSSNEKLAAFAVQVSHDLRTPLTAIMINTEMLSAEPAVSLDSDLQRVVHDSLRAGRRMDGMIQAMLDHASLGAELGLTDVDLNALVPEVLDEVVAGREPLPVVRVGDLPVVRADAHHLYALMQNILTNAVKFTPDGVTPEIDVTGRAANGSWRIEVHDNGIGVPEDAREQVFDLFSRSSSTARGHGIGLATARRIVEAHRGRIGLDPRSEGGTTVWFELPR